jgi:hypothetical protein
VKLSPVGYETRLRCTTALFGFKGIKHSHWSGQLQHIDWPRAAEIAIRALQPRPRGRVAPHKTGESDDSPPIGPRRHRFLPRPATSHRHPASSKSVLESCACATGIPNNHRRRRGSAATTRS